MVQSAFFSAALCSCTHAQETATIAIPYAVLSKDAGSSETEPLKDSKRIISQTRPFIVTPPQKIILKTGDSFAMFSEWYDGNGFKIVVEDIGTKSVKLSRFTTLNGNDIPLDGPTQFGYDKKYALLFCIAPDPELFKLDLHYAIVAMTKLSKTEISISFEPIPDSSLSSIPTPVLFP